MEIQSQSINASVSLPVQGNSAAVVGTTSAANSTAAPAAVATPDRKQLEAAVKSMDEHINVTQPPQLAFSIDETTNKPVVRITDAATGDLIRQIPSEEALRIAQSLDQMNGLLLKQQA